MPISGVTCEQPRASLGVSPAASIDARQIVAPLSASIAYTLSCSVATNRRLRVPCPGMTTADK